MKKIKDMRKVQGTLYIQALWRMRKMRLKYLAIIRCIFNLSNLSNYLDPIGLERYYSVSSAWKKSKGSQTSKCY
jgi:hypothetical protein